MDEIEEAYGKMQDSHWDYLAAREDSGEIIEDPEYTEWLSPRNDDLIDAIDYYRLVCTLQ